MSTLPDLLPFINEHLGLPKTNGKFPGCLPVSIHKKDILSLYGHCENSMVEYVVSHKADGLRYFMMFYRIENKPRCILLDRAGSILQLRVSVYDWLYQGTIFDVELIQTSGGYLILIFDTICINGHNYRECFYPVRMELARMTLIELQSLFPGPCGIPLTETCPGMYPTNCRSTCFQISDHDQIAVYLTTKGIYYPQALVFLHQSPGYPTDGFIWTSTAIGYTPFRTSVKSVLKWKPAGNITVDFLITDKRVEFVFCNDIPAKYILTTGKLSLYTIYNGDFVFVSRIDADIELTGVYECDWTGKWGIVKYRKEKNTPNHLSTVLQTLRNIDEDLSSLDLIEHLDPYLKNNR